MKYPQIRAKAQPKWFELRWRISNLLVQVARRIYPKSPEIEAFWAGQLMKRYVEYLIEGVGTIKIKWEENNG